MAIEMNIPAVIAKAKAKIALLEGIIADNKKLRAEYEKTTEAVRIERTKAYNKWAQGVLKQGIKKIASDSKVRINNTWRGIELEMTLSPDSLDLTQPDWDALFPYPNLVLKDFPAQYRRNGVRVSENEQIAELRNSISWLECVEPGTKFTVSEFNRITANL